MIVGASSAIAQAAARCFAHDGDRLFLVGRDAAKLDAVAQDLQVRGAEQVETFVMDVSAYDRHEEVIAEAERRLDGLDTLLIAHGTLPDQVACQCSFDETLQQIEINALSTISLLTRAANRFEAQGRGTLAVISSVAGDRGRKSNYVYGAAKAAISTFMQGLRNRLHDSGVHVLTIKPGFVDTPMTVQFKKGVLWADSTSVGRGIHRAIQRRKDVVYLPAFWRIIMFIIRQIPEAIFKRLSI